VADGSGLLDLKTLHPMHSDAANGRISVRPKASVSKRCAEFNGGPQYQPAARDE
jgi:hypothetical protein